MSATDTAQPITDLGTDERRFRWLFDSLGAYAIVLLAPDGTIVDVSAGAGALSARAPHDLCGRAHETLALERDGAAVSLARARDAARHEPQEFAGWRRRGDGERYWADVILTALRDDEGRIVGYSDVSRDGTARYEAEQEVRRGRARLAEAERVARLGSWEWDLGADRAAWSDELYRMRGLQPGPAVTPRAELLAHVHPEDRETLEVAVGRAIEGEGRYEVDHRLVRADGRVRIVRARGEVIVDGRARPLRLVGTTQDVTELRRAEEALKQASSELERRAEELQLARGRPEPARPARPRVDEPRWPLGPAAPGPRPLGADERATTLTARQREILVLVARGCSNAGIADELVISEATVKSHLKQILRKLGATNRAEAVARAATELRL